MTKVKESIRTPRPARTRKPSKGQQVGYLRVSSLDQNEVRQLEGLALNKTFTDKASGKDAKRPQLEAMQSFVREGDTVFCHSMDRLARNLDDLRRIVLGLTERGVHWGAPRFLRFGELDDDFDIVSPPQEGACEVLRPLPSSDQPIQPRTVRPSQGFLTLIPVPLVGVDAADDDAVLQDCLSGNICRGDPGASATAADARKTDNASGREFLYGVEYHRSGAGAFDDDIWLEAYVGDSTRMVRGTQGAHKVRLETGINPIKNMNVQSALHSQQRREQADWTRARHKHRPRIPKGTPADRVDVLPRLCNDGRWLKQNTQ
jgi:hypothetical protein